MIVIHYEPGIEWQRARVGDMKRGIERLGHIAVLSQSRVRIAPDSPAIVFGTTLFQSIEEDSGDTLLVDRASYGDPDFVQLVWNGRGRNGDHAVPDPVPGYRAAAHGVRPADPPKAWGNRRILCGDFNAPANWYDEMSEVCTHFKPHPADNGRRVRDLITVSNFSEVDTAYVYNSSVAIELAILGVQVEVSDPGCLGYNLDWNWLAWTLWTWAEIADGEPIRHVINYAKLKDRGSA